MSSTTLAKLSLTVQPETRNLNEPDVQNTSNAGYRKIDIELVKQNGVSDPHDVKSQENEIIHENVATSNGVSEKDQSNQIETVTQHPNLLPSGAYPENGINDEKPKNNQDNIANGDNNTVNQFQRLPKPQQDILLLHGPGQRYRLGKAHNIPELKSDHEILVQV